MDYKEILRSKASKLQDLLERYGANLSPDEINSIRTLIENTHEITNGRLDALDYDVRNEGIMNYYAQLDSAFSKFKGFEEIGKEEQTETREDV